MLRRVGAYLVAALAAASLVVAPPTAGAAESVRCGGEAATIIGTEGDDVLVGTGGPDVIHGLTGRDIIRGLGGNDILCGGGGRDRIWGGRGQDFVYAGSSVDRVRGGPGHDVIRGGGRNDTLRGGNQGDLIRGGAGNDVAFGGNGIDYCIAADSSSCGEEPTAAANVLMPGDNLLAGQQLTSPDGAVTLRVAGSGNVEIWRNGVDLWDTDTAGNHDARLKMSSSGDLQVVRRGEVLWSAGTAAMEAAARLKNDANLVIVAPAEGLLWDRRSNPGQIDWHLPFPVGESWEVGAPHGENSSALDFGPHNGGGDVAAVASGFVGWYQCESGGRYLQIEHGDGFMSTYYHLVNIRTELVGQWVEAGTVVGEAGNGVPCGGRSTFEHVHLTLWRDGERLSADGLIIRGYTVHAGSQPYHGHWTNTATGETILVNPGGAVCCLANNG